jgi:L-fuconolactonase
MPWLDDLPQLRRAFDLTDFDAATRGLEVESLVYVQVDVTPSYSLLEARAAVEQPDPRVAAVVAWAPIEDGPPLDTYLGELQQLGPRVKGVRRLLESEPDPEFLVSPAFVDGLRRLPEYGLSFDICIRHAQLERAVEMVRRCPDTSFVLDHLGKPDVCTHQLDPWRAQLAELARLPNVVGCKISGLVTEADHRGWTVDDLAPFVGHALEVFGEDRVMFGGDWPVVTLASTYRRWVETLDSLTTGLSAGARKKLWADNARRVYRL